MFSFSRPDVPESFKADTDALKKAVPGNEDVIRAITVGSETLYRGNFTGPELLKKINQVQKMFPKVDVGTADSWNKYADGTADALISGGVNFLYVPPFPFKFLHLAKCSRFLKHSLVNAFAFWQGQEINNATDTFFDDMMQAVNRIHKIAGPDAKDIYIATGETGWPTGTSFSDISASECR